MGRIRGELSDDSIGDDLPPRDSIPEKLAGFGGDREKGFGLIVQEEGDVGVRGRRPGEEEPLTGEGDSLELG